MKARLKHKVIVGMNMIEGGNYMGRRIEDWFESIRLFSFRICFFFLFSFSLAEVFIRP